MPRAKLSDISLKQLVAEIGRRQAKLTNLLAQRDELNARIAELQAVAGAEPVAPAKRRGRPPGSKNKKAARAGAKPLVQYVQQVLAKAGRGLNAKEIEAKVLAAGYPTKAATIYNPVMKVLGKAFKRVSRGVYTLLGAKAAPAKAKAGGKRGQFSQTAEELILGLAKGGGATTGDINKAWKAAGRKGKADVTLTKMVKGGKLNRKKLAVGKGSTYTVA